MRAVTLPILMFLLALTALSATGDMNLPADSRIMKFQLYQACEPMWLEVITDEESRAIQDELTAALESRLRSARLYRSNDEDANSRLILQVTIAGPAFLISLEFSKEVYDPASDTEGVTATWDLRVVGWLPDLSHIVTSAAQQMDSFLTEFLRVNEGACVAPNTANATSTNESEIGVFDDFFDQVKRELAGESQ